MDDPGSGAPDDPGMAATDVPRRRSPLRLTLAAALVLAGLVWIGQGLGILTGRSFMVGDPRWAIIGAVAAGVGVVVAWRAARG